MEDIVNFGEYAKKMSNIDLEKKANSFSKVNENIEEENIEEENSEETHIEEENSEETYIEEESIEEDYTEEGDQYILFKDKEDFFSCDIEVEGANTDETFARLVIESDDWTLMFEGDIIDGKVDIPIRKLSILNEGQVGNIRLEVVAEGTHFIPWEDEFRVKLSKKVTVKVNESQKRRRPKKINEKKVNVKVNK